MKNTIIIPKESCITDETPFFNKQTNTNNHDWNGFRNNESESLVIRRNYYKW